MLNRYTYEQVKMEYIDAKQSHCEIEREIDMLINEFGVVPEDKEAEEEAAYARYFKALSNLVTHGLEYAKGEGMDLETAQILKENFYRCLPDVRDQIIGKLLSL